jgi:hypothetical protein
MTESFQSNSEVCKVNPRHRCDLCRPIANTVFEKGMYYAGIKLYNKLPAGSKSL